VTTVLFANRAGKGGLRLFLVELANSKIGWPRGSIVFGSNPNELISSGVGDGLSAEDGSGDDLLIGVIGWNEFCPLKIRWTSNTTTTGSGCKIGGSFIGRGNSNVMGDSTSKSILAGTSAACK
jgi:hypothetical protein